MFIDYFVILVFGLIFGSFLTAYTYRIPRGIKISKGRSQCPGCGKKIDLKNNIPVLSYLLLRGRCPDCKKKISKRYPLIESLTAACFIFTYHFFVNASFGSPIFEWKVSLGVLALPFLLTIAVAMIAVFVIDMEHMIIPDELVFFLIGFVTLGYFAADVPILLSFSVGFIAASFLLILNLATLGKGMGLGDVKLAIAIGLILSWPYGLSWMFLSFILGAVVGVIMIVFGKTNFGKHIPFGPFMILAYFIVLFVGLVLPGMPI